MPGPWVSVPTILQGNLYRKDRGRTLHKKEIGPSFLAMLLFVVLSNPQNNKVTCNLYSLWPNPKCPQIVKTIPN